MPKLVVFLKNSTLLALLVVLFCTNPQIQSNAPELPNPQPITPQKLMRAACHFALNKVCNGSGGFTGDTLVKTSTSYAKISDLKTGTLVITFDETTGYLCEQSVTAVTTTLANTTLWLTLGDEESTTICTGTQQTFYSYNPLAKTNNPKNHNWLKSAVLQNCEVFAGGRNCSILKIREATTLTKLYLIEVANTHNFFVSKADVLVHNNPLGLPALAEIATETAMLVAAGAKIVVDAVTGKNNPDNNTPKEQTETNNAGVFEAKIKKPEVKSKSTTDLTTTNTTPDGPGKPPEQNKGNLQENAIKTGVAVAVSAEVKAWYKEIKGDSNSEQDNKKLKNDNADLINDKINLVNEKSTLINEVIKLRQEKEESLQRAASAERKNKINKQKLIEKDNEIAKLRLEIQKAYAAKQNPPE